MWNVIILLSYKSLTTKPLQFLVELENFPSLLWSHPQKYVLNHCFSTFSSQSLETKISHIFFKNGHQSRITFEIKSPLALVIINNV